jgi:hypothetical protein
VRAARVVVLTQTLRIVAAPAPSGPAAPKEWDVRAVVAVGAATFPVVAHEGVVAGDIPARGHTRWTEEQTIAAVELIPAQLWGQERRRRFCIINAADARLYLGYYDDPSLTDWDTFIEPWERYEEPLPVWQGRVAGIWAGDGAGFAHMTEWVRAGVFAGGEG